MLSTRTWLVIAALFVVWGAWHASGTVEYVYSERWTDDGVLRVSKVVCGTGPSVALFDDYHEDVRGPATAADCRQVARTRLLEVGLIWLGAAAAVSIGIRYGADPPRPIDAELKPLPKGERVVEGRTPRR